MRVRNDLSSQDLYDATLRFLDLMRASRAFEPDPLRARLDLLNSIEVFLRAIVAEDKAA